MSRPRIEAVAVAAEQGRSDGLASNKANKDVDAEQWLKCTAVLLRDNTSISLGKALEVFIYCWRHTESEAMRARRIKQ